MTAGSVTSATNGRPLVMIDEIHVLRHDIAELSAQRKRFTLAHDLAHAALGQEEINQAGAAAVCEALGLLQQVVMVPAAGRAISSPVITTAPAVCSAELTHALPDSLRLAMDTGTSSAAPILAHVGSATVTEAPASSAQRFALTAALSDSTFLRFIARFIADLSIALVRVAGSGLGRLRTCHPRSMPPLWPPIRT
jgi:hypothetical protein